MRITPQAAPPIIAIGHAPTSEPSAPDISFDQLTSSLAADRATEETVQRKITSPNAAVTLPVQPGIVVASAIQDGPATNTVAGVPTADPERAAVIPGTGTAFMQASQAQRNHNVFGFNRLGVFGRYGAMALPDPSHADVGWSAPSVSETPQMPEIASLSIRLAVSPQSGPYPLQQLPGRAAGGVVQGGEVGPHAPDADVIHLANQPHAQVASLAVPGAMPETRCGAGVAEDVFPASGDVHAAAAGQPERRSGTTGPSLVVSDTSDGLSIIARSMDALENYSGLRRRLEDTAAEFGMKVSEFQPNGSSSQALASTPGDPHGSRTR